MGCTDDFPTGYVVGFIDAEASFSVSIKYQRGYGVRLDPMFGITQLSEKPLELIRDVIKAGRIIRKPGQRHLHLYVVDRIDELSTRLVPFLDTHRQMLVAKGEAYDVFREIVTALANGEHKKRDGLRRLVELAYKLSQMNPKSRRKRTLQEVLKLLNPDF